jgi:hypothetical protein
MKSSLLLAGLTGQVMRLLINVKLLIPMWSHPESPDQSIQLEANLMLVFLEEWLTHKYLWLLF